jgi:hypothetical protein
MRIKRTAAVLGATVSTVGVLMIGPAGSVTTTATTHDITARPGVVYLATTHDITGITR